MDNAIIYKLPEYLKQIFSPETPQRKDIVKVGRNQPCPCGSNLKFKKCCIDNS